MSIYYPEYHKKIWGYELWIANSELYCGKILHVDKGCQLSYHFHKIKDETFFILDGMIKIIVEGEIKTMAPGQTIHLKPNTKHTVFALKTSDILEISTQHFEEDSNRLIQGFKGGDEWKILEEIKKL